MCGEVKKKSPGRHSWKGRNKIVFGISAKNHSVSIYDYKIKQNDDENCPPEEALGHTMTY